MNEFIEKYNQFKDYIDTENKERMAWALKVSSESKVDMHPVFLDYSLDEFVKWLKANRA